MQNLYTIILPDSNNLEKKDQNREQKKVTNTLSRCRVTKETVRVTGQKCRVFMEFALQEILSLLTS